MPVQRPVYQLPLELDLPEPEEGISQEEVRFRSEAARKALEGMYGKAGSPKWLEDYVELVKGSWPWRVAAYIAWASSPKINREPRTQDELARLHLGLTSDRAITTWRRRNPAIDETVRMMQAGPLFKHRPELYAALISVAVKPDYKGHADRKLAFELLGDYVPVSRLQAEIKRRGLNVDDLAAMSDAELMDLAKAMDAEPRLKEEDHDADPA